MYSSRAVRVELCLFDDVTGKESARIALPEQTRNVWHGYLNGIGPGQLYGYPRPRPLRAARRHPLQPQQAADRSVRARDRRQRSIGARRFSATDSALAPKT